MHRHTVLIYPLFGMEDKYERQDDSYNMFEYITKVLCLNLYLKSCSSQFIVLKTVVHLYIFLYQISMRVNEADLEFRSL